MDNAKRFERLNEICDELKTILPDSGYIAEVANCAILLAREEFRKADPTVSYLSEESIRENIRFWEEQLTYWTYKLTVDRINKAAGKLV